MIHVTTTCDTVETARALARSALQARLVACANISPGILSLFHWRGAVDEEEEVAITFKTVETHREALIALITREHPYDLPVITWATVGTTEEAEAWCREETTARPE